jgi:hypothetical protein
MNHKNILLFGLMQLFPAITFGQLKIDSTELVFTRNPYYFPAGIFYKAKIKNNGKIILKIMQNQQRSVFVPSGDINLSAKNIRTSRLNFQCSPDTIYYISVKVGGLFLDKINLKVTKKIRKLR